MFFKRSVAIPQQQLLRQMNYNRAAVQPQNGSYAKTMENIAKTAKTVRDLYLELQIVSTSATNQTVVIFDAQGAYADQQSYVQPGTVTITGVSKNYQLVINKLITGKFIINELHLETLSNKLTQFAQPLSFWDDSMKVDNISISQSIFPNAGRNSMQQQLNMVELPEISKIVEATTALVFDIVPGNTYNLRFFMQEVKIVA